MQDFRFILFIIIAVSIETKAQYSLRLVRYLSSLDH